MIRGRFLFAFVLLAGCGAWTMKTPENFDGENLAVGGRSRHTVFGPYALTHFNRDWTRGGALSVSILRSAKRTQRYEFHVVRDSVLDVHTRCEFEAKGKRLGMRDGFDFVLGDGAELECTATVDSAEHKLMIRTEGEAALAGTFTADTTYRVQGIGTSALSNNSRGPVGGFHIFQEDRMVALVQILNDQQVVFARGLDARQRDDLAPAIAALLLLDETIREFD
jgi:hypothetical protein